MIDLQDSLEMFEKNPVAQAVIDADLKIILVNEAFIGLTGYSRDRLLTIRFTDFREKGMIKYLENVGESVVEARSTRRTAVGQSTFETPSGIHIVIRTNIPILDEKGDVKYIYITYNEITMAVKGQKYLEQEIDGLIQIYEKMAAGDLTPRYNLTEPDKDTREIYRQIIRLRDAVRGIVGNLQINIRDVNKRMQTLTAQAKSAEFAVKDASAGVQQIAVSTGKMSDNVEEASNGVEQISKAMQDMSASVEEITSSMDSVTTLARDANELSRAGAGLAGKAEISMGEISTSSAKVYAIVDDVEKQMGEISKIVVLIRDLASQTNLLALNAAIEAARAGDAGRGFAVVATEVKSLAQESRNSAERIEEMIDTLKKSTQNASIAMGDAKLVVDQGARMVTETLQSFNRIAEAVDMVTQSAADVAAATEEQAATTEEITASIHEVASLMEQTTIETTGTAAATEESSVALDTITQMVEDVDRIAVEAMEANKKFKVE